MQLLVVVLHPFNEFEWYAGDNSTIYALMERIIQLLLKHTRIMFNRKSNRQIFNENKFLQQNQCNRHYLSRLVMLFKDDLKCLYIWF